MNRFLSFLIFLELGIWSLELSSAPLHPANPYPPHLATSVPANADLTWTPGDMELIRNGNFETGTFINWSRVNQGGGGGGANNNTYINDGVRRPFNQDIAYPPYAGSYSAVTDQDGPGLISIYQDVFVPASALSVWLTWSDQIHNYFNEFVAEAPPLRQEYRVELRTTNDAVRAVIYRTEPGDPTWTGWSKRAFDLTPYKGQNVRIAFLEEQWRSFFHLFLDNISVRVRSLGPVSYDVYFGTNAVPGSNQFRGTVNAGSWPLPQLVPQQTYFWRVDARLGANLFVGPVWRFTTAPVGPLDHFTWDPIGSPKSPDVSFGLSLTARDSAENLVTNNIPFDVFAHMVESISTNSMQTDLIPSVYAAFENTTVGYSFTPSADLLVIGSRSEPNGKVSLWTDEGILLGSNPGSAPIQLYAGRTYRAGLYSAGNATNYLRFDALSTFPHGTIDQSYEGSGDTFPTRPHPARWWLIDLVYAAPTLSPPFLSGAVSTIDSSGEWVGLATIPSTGLLQFRAVDWTGKPGIANIFSVAEILQLGIVKEGNAMFVDFPPLADRAYILESSQTLAPGSWVQFGDPINGPGTGFRRLISPTNTQGFFRLKRSE